MANKLTGVAAALIDLPAEVVEEAVARFDVLAAESASRVVGGGATMRMHTRRGRVAVKLGTRSKITSSGDFVTAFIDGTPKGPWVWIESGTGAHAVGRRGDFLKGSGYGHPMRAPLAHPGSRGQGAWTRAVNDLSTEYPEIGIKRLGEIARG